MTRASTIALVILLAATSVAAQTPAPAPAPPPAAQPAPAPQFPAVRVGMVSYLQYDAELKNRAGFNAFDLTRGYINVTAAFSPNLRFRFTPDIRRATDGSLSGSLVLRVKYGFLQADNVGPATSWVRLGLSQTPWLDFEERIDRYRVQGTMFSEREGLLPSSGDFGIGYFTPIGGSWAEAHVGVYNGEGASQTDTNKYKSVQGRLTVRPFPNGPVAKGLRFSGFYNAGWYAADRPRRTGLVAGHFEDQRLVVLLQQVFATERPTALLPANIDRSGTSAYVEVRQGLQGWAGWMRVERFDPDTGVSNNARRRAIAAVAYWMRLSGAQVGFVVNDEDVHYGSADGRPDENRFLAQVHVEF